MEDLQRRVGNSLTCLVVDVYGVKWLSSCVPRCLYHCACPPTQPYCPSAVKTWKSPLWNSVSLKISHLWNSVFLDSCLWNSVFFPVSLSLECWAVLWRVRTYHSAPQEEVVQALGLTGARFWSMAQSLSPPCWHCLGLSAGNVFVCMYACVYVCKCVCANVCMCVKMS